MNLPQKYLNQIKKIFYNQGVIFAYLFGSQVSGKVGPLSDIDIAVYFDERVSPSRRFDNKLKLMAQLSLLLKKEDIDVVILNEAYPLLEQRIIKNGEIIYSTNEKKRLDYEVKAIMRYLDFKPYLEKHTKEILYGR